MINGKPTVTFDEKAKDFLIESLGLHVDEQGYLCSDFEFKHRVGSGNGEEVRKEEWVGFVHGYGHVKGDIISLVHLSDWTDAQIQKGVRQK